VIEQLPGAVRWIALSADYGTSDLMFSSRWQLWDYVVEARRLLPSWVLRDDRGFGARVSETFASNLKASDEKPRGDTPKGASFKDTITRKRIGRSQYDG